MTGLPAAELDGQLDAGFTDEPTETPVAETPPVEPQETPEFVQVTSEDYRKLMDAAERLGTLESTVSQRLDTAFGKIGGLQRFIEEKAANTPNGQDVVIDDEDIAELTADYPDLAKPLRTMLQRVLGKGRGSASPTVDVAAIRQELAPQIAKEAADETERRLEVKAVLRKHSDFHEVKVAPEFREWLGKQPPEFQAQLGASWEADVIIPALDRYKKERASESKANLQRSRIADAVAPKGTGQQLPVPKGPNADFEAGFNDDS